MSMKIRKTTALIITAFFLFIGSSFAQNSKKEQGAKALTDTMKTQLSLNDDQYKQVYAINLDFISKVAAVKQDGDSKMAKFKKLKAMDEDRDAALQKILTDDQFKDFQDFKQENRKEMKARFRKQ